MGKFSKFYTTVAINIVNVLVLLLVIELGTRALLEHITPIDINAQTLVTDKGQEPFFQSNPFAAFAWIPGARFGRQTVNSEGFVSTREIAFPRQANELRVVTLGGSSTVGNGNTDETTYPRLLEAKLQQAYPDRVVNVINAAAGGYSTIESLGYLQSRMIHWQPDVVVIMHGWNDMYYFALSDQEISKWRDNFNLQAMWNPKAALKMDDPMPADVQYLSWSQFYLHLREWVRSTAYDGESNPQEVIEGRYQFARLNDDGTMSVALQPINANAERLYETNMAQFRSICAKREIRCLSVLQASLLSDKANPDDPKVRQGAKTAVLYH
ncbi:MAG: SGNH/GDSL hydrolase family protein, partial [Gammaproteobacteria bacterium]